MAIAARPVTVHRDSPLCGDVIDLTVVLDDDQVVSASRRSRACSLVNASARILETVVPGRSFDEARALAERVQQAVRGHGPLPDGFDVVAPVLLMPSRRKCVLLPWEALTEALDRS